MQLAHVVLASCVACIAARTLPFKSLLMNHQFYILQGRFNSNLSPFAAALDAPKLECEAHANVSVRVGSDAM